MNDLKTILGRLEFPDDAGVVAQLSDQAAKVQENLAGVRRTVLVMSGKGGVGKSTVTVNLALALARRGLRVGVLDADLNGPCVPYMLGLAGRAWAPEGGRVAPLEGPLGIKVASMAFFLEGDAPVRYDGPTELSSVWLGMMETTTLREFLGDVAWGDLDALLIDMPPGAAADKPPAVLRWLQAPEAVLVTTASRVADQVVARSRRYAEVLGVPVRGTVVNMAGLFDAAAAPPADELARVPFDRELAASLDAGEPLPPDHAVCGAFDGVAATLCETPTADTSKGAER